MDELPCIFPALVSLILLWFIVKWLYKPVENKNILPPSPRKLPILGNLHQLGSLPHLNLHFLAKKHGPLMLLHFGTVPVLIVSSADAACEILKAHDLTFPNRPSYKINKKLLYDGKDVAFSTYGEYWRKAKSILVHELLSNKRVQSFRSIREEEIALFMKKMGESSPGPLNLSKMFFELANEVICRSAFGRKYSDSENGKKLLIEFMELLGIISIGDYIPWLSWISGVNGLDKRVDRVGKGIDEFLESVIRERLETNQDKNGENFVDIMLEIFNDNTTVSIDRDCIKAIILDAFAGGTDTISTVLEWAMTELLRHPKTMKLLQNETREITKKHINIISDEDLAKMHYLKAVIKETLRLHPPVPMLVPRVASKDVKIKGYDISSGTVVMTNAWAIGRDPVSWDEPEKFEPERFLNSSIDFKGLDFELIPFGSGRRGCPGISYAVATIEFVLANVVRKFEWELPDGSHDLDMSGRPGFTLHRAIPLLALARGNDLA